MMMRDASRTACRRAGTRPNRAKARLRRMVDSPHPFGRRRNTLIRTRHKSTILLRSAMAAILLLGSGLVHAQDETQEPLDAAALIADGAFYLERGDCALAQFFYQEALRSEPGNADALV